MIKLMLVLGLTMAPIAKADCNFQAVAVANTVFNQRASAQNECNSLLQQTGAEATACKVVRLNNGKFRAQFRKALQLQNVNLGQIIAGIQDFIQQFNLFATNKIQLNSRAGNGCGSILED